MQSSMYIACIYIYICVCVYDDANEVLDATLDASNFHPVILWRTTKSCPHELAHVPEEMKLQ